VTLLVSAWTIGLILSLLALGVYISYRVFKFADITADGSITFGAAVAASMLTHGIHPVIASSTCEATRLSDGGQTFGFRFLFEPKNEDLTPKAQRVSCVRDWPASPSR
jgi:putative exporter of polyketide antibiotics